MRQSIVDIAAKLSVPPQWLEGLIAFETAGTYSPTISNPYSSAIGLIQLTDAPAYEMFGMSSLEVIAKYPEFDSQMRNVVYPYLKRYAPFPTKQSLYMAIFYPAYRYVDPQTVFSPEIQAVNKGIRTVQDYIDKVDKKVASIKFVRTAVPGIALLTLAVAGAWYLS